MTKERKTNYPRKIFQFIFGFVVGIMLWGLTLIVLLILN